MAQPAGETDVLLQRATLALQDGDLDAARTFFSIALAQNADSLYARTKLATISAMEGDLDAAERLLREVLARAPGYKLALNNLGSVQIEKGHYTQAIECLTAATRIDARYAKAHHNLAIAQRKVGDLRGSVRSLKRSMLLQLRLDAKGELARLRRGRWARSVRKRNREAGSTDDATREPASPERDATS